MRNATLDEAQAGIKNAGRNINNLRYADETTLMAESEEELKSLLRKVKKESEKAGFKAQHSENEDRGIRSHHFMANRWETVETVADFIFLGSKITADGDCSHEIRRHLLLGRKVLTNLDSRYGEGNSNSLRYTAWKIPGTVEPGRLWHGVAKS